MAAPLVFTSQIFLFWFLPIVLGLYYALPRRGRSYMLTLASYSFYGWWRVDFTVLMLVTTVVDYGVGAVMGRLGERMEAAGLTDGQRARLARWRRLACGAAMGANLGLLAYYKYMNFGVATLDHLFVALGLPHLAWPPIVLPVGISFYTFQSMSYTIDVYRREVPPARRFIDFMCFVSLFPHLVCGPILRYRSVAPQIAGRTHTFEKFATGCFLFQAGFAKKLLLADVLARLVDACFAVALPTTGEAWLGTLAYSFQIYFDFSGYSDMAIGLGLMLGFVFPPNFDSPYRSRSITEFWRRWHISLSSWLRDYLYVSLGGNRAGAARTYVNLMVTMLLGGLWHGASWTFVAWGAYHGALLVLERAAGKRPLYARLPAPLRVAATFALVMGGWVLFRAQTFTQAFRFLWAMAGRGASLALPDVAVDRLQWTALAACAVVVWGCPSSQDLARRPPRVVAYGMPVLFLLSILQLFFRSYTPFLYFQF